MKLLNLCLILLLSFFCGCSTFSRITGGKVTHKSATGSVTFQNQSEDPKSPSNLDTQSSKITRLPIPAGSIIKMDSPVSSKDNPDPVVITISSNTVLETIIEDKAKTQIGASQENIAQKIGAVLSGMRPVMYAGIIVMLVGIGTLHPKLKLILGFSNTQSFMVIGGGLALIFLPQIFAQYGKLIIGLIIAAVVGYIFIYRYSEASTKAKVYKQFIDANNDGIDDNTGQTKEEFDKKK